MESKRKYSQYKKAENGGNILIFMYLIKKKKIRIL